MVVTVITTFLDDIAWLLYWKLNIELVRVSVLGDIIPSKLICSCDDEALFDCIFTLNQICRTTIDNRWRLNQVSIEPIQFGYWWTLTSASHQMNLLRCHWPQIHHSSDIICSLFFMTFYRDIISLLRFDALLNKKKRLGCLQSLDYPQTALISLIYLLSSYFGLSLVEICERIWALLFAERPR